MQPFGGKRQKKQTSWEKEDKKCINYLDGILKMHPELPCFFLRPLFAIMPRQKGYDSLHLEGFLTNEFPVDGDKPTYICRYFFIEPVYLLPHFDTSATRFFIDTTLTRQAGVIISENG